MAPEKWTQALDDELMASAAAAPIPGGVISIDYSRPGHQDRENPEPVTYPLARIGAFEFEHAHVERGADGTSHYHGNFKAMSAAFCVEVTTGSPACRALAEAFMRNPGWKGGSI